MPHVPLSAFNVRGASKRAKLLIALAEQMGEQIPVTTLMSEVYGDERGSKSAFASIVEGLEAIAERQRLPYVIQRMKIGKENTLGLYSTALNPSQPERKEASRTRS
jgi:hypothetical protein